MIPHDLPPRLLTFPDTQQYSIVLLTGNALRHERFALRMRQEFGDLVAAWYQIQPAASLPRQKQRVFPRLRTALGKGMHALITSGSAAPFRILRCFRIHGVLKTISKSLLLSNSLFYSGFSFLQKRLYPLQNVEHAIFGEEVAELRKTITLQPIPIEQPHSEDFVRTLHTISPYFLLSLGGPLYSSQVIACCRGVALNQHAGWSPTYKGSYTTEWALYHRQLNFVGSTVHIMTSGADAGPIVRRSHPCLLPDDTPAACFTRVVALGTELMIEVVHEIMANRQILVYDQTEPVGKTYQARELTRDIQRAIDRDFASQWLGKELERQRYF